MIDCGFRYSESLTHFTRRNPVEVEEQESLIGWRKSVEEFLEPFNEAVLAFFGKVVVGVVVEREEHR